MRKVSVPIDRFGPFIRAARERAGFTQEEVADEIGHTVDSVSRIERNVNGTTFNTLWKMAKMFECEVGDLLPQSNGVDEVLLGCEAVAKLIRDLPEVIQKRIIRVCGAMAREVRTWVEEGEYGEAEVQKPARKR